MSLFRAAIWLASSVAMHVSDFLPVSSTILHLSSKVVYCFVPYVTFGWISISVASLIALRAGMSFVYLPEKTGRAKMRF